MFLYSHPLSDRAPLDFNTPPRTESVADALVSEPGPAENPRAPAAESLLEELGLSGHLARSIIEERSGSGAME